MIDVNVVLDRLDKLHSDLDSKSVKYANMAFGVLQAKEIILQEMTKGENQDGRKSTAPIK